MHFIAKRVQKTSLNAMQPKCLIACVSMLALITASYCFTNRVGRSQQSAIQASVQQSNPFVEVVQKQLDCYNKQDLDGFCATFSDDCTCKNYPNDVVVKGQEQLRSRYAEIFGKHPKNRCDLIHRICVNNKVIDQEKVYRDGGNQLTFELVAVYTVETSPKGKLVISNVDFVK